MTEYHRVRGDVNDSLVIELRGVDSLATVISVEAHVSYGGANPTTLPAAVESATLRTVRIDLSAWLPTATAGAWDLETQPVFGDGSSPTFPSKGTDKIIVRAPLG